MRESVFNLFWTKKAPSTDFGLLEGAHRIEVVSTAGMVGDSPQSSPLEPFGQPPPVPPPAQAGATELSIHLEKSGEKANRQDQCRQKCEGQDKCDVGQERMEGPLGSRAWLKSETVGGQPGKAQQPWSRDSTLRPTCDQKAILGSPLW